MYLDKVETFEFPPCGPAARGAAACGR
eukprot:SAG22_NODE_14584_length_370_cov_11.970480_1_plen_26_part_10